MAALVRTMTAIGSTITAIVNALHAIVRAMHAILRVMRALAPAVPATRAMLCAMRAIVNAMPQWPQCAMKCTISLKDNDRQRQSVDLTQVREEYRQQLLEWPIAGAHEVESHVNACPPSSSHGSADPWSSSCVVETKEVYGQNRTNCQTRPLSSTFRCHGLKKNSLFYLCRGSVI